ncbi:Vitelline membrane outer layer protein 1 [Daphnia magna]|uniref:Vitelline membrane outer layer protein 1 n=1 Tax=Daphnia magna TaxID=35525 RepID=A0A164TNI6_9CRUS|nr:Vitelline membrane outer layer protein 1 [Daphnia magna]
MTSAIALIIFSCSALLPNAAAIFWGDWGLFECCPDNTPAIGFKLKTERPQGRGDDTALNGISLKCRSDSWVSSSVGPWGNYGNEFICPANTFLTSCQLRVEGRQGRGDDTAANNLNCKCSNGQILYGDGTHWGGWMAWSDECPTGICGLKTRVEGRQGNGDDTALNDVLFRCC